jgi:hypothetical protein
MLDEQLDNPADADLFFVIEVVEPSGELVGTFDLPCHILSMPLNALCVKGYTSAVRAGMFDRFR